MNQQQTALKMALFTAIQKDPMKLYGALARHETDLRANIAKGKRAIPRKRNDSMSISALLATQCEDFHGEGFTSPEARKYSSKLSHFVTIANWINIGSCWRMPGSLSYWC